MKSKQIINILGLVIMLAVNLLANALPINGVMTGEISDSIPSLFTPAGYVFAIWGVIYLALLAFTIYQALPSQQNNKVVDRIGPWFFISSIFNAAWIFAWHYSKFGLSVLLMLGLLVSLIILYVRSGIGKAIKSRSDYAFISLPFGIYFGWISVATIANISSYLVVNNWNGLGLSAILWTQILLVIGAILGILMTLVRKEIGYPLVIVWAFMGIYISRAESLPIQLTAGIGAGLVLIALIAGLISRKNKQSA